MQRFGATPLIERRTFFKAAGAGFAAALAPHAAFAASQTDAVFASAYRNADGQYGIAVLTEQGSILHKYALPARGHDLVRQPNGNMLVAFARRPGTFAAIVDLDRTNQPRIIAAPPRRHLYGHGVFSADGRLLYATENDFDAARGVIGIYDASDGYQRIGEFDTFGTGPHDMALLPDGKTLVVANGGIETHPDYPRAKLNLPTMVPSLAFIDTLTGDLIARYELPTRMHKLSIRHLALGRDGTIWFACQNEGDIAEPVPLVGRASANTGDFAMVDLPPAETRALRGYIGSIAANHRTGNIAITSPRGGVAFAFDPAGGAAIQSLHRTDVCGVASSRSGFVFSSGEGAFAGQKHTLSFDNHIAPLKVIRPGA